MCLGSVGSWLLERRDVLAPRGFGGSFVDGQNDLGAGALRELWLWEGRHGF
ncbi:hypothetical protein ABID23_000953 [Bartonella silvatica]|uniref:Uncharacterized protein n=1 Tax=Bartonella silvatica TaxID=357760 RepID=A0ABV2HH72_9HYPH